MTIHDFLLDLVAIRGLSLNTRDAYANDLRIFDRYVDNILDATQKDITDFIASERAKGFNDKTVARRLASIKSYFDFCVKQGALEENPCKNIPKAKAPLTLPRVLSVKDVTAICDASERVGRTPLERARNKVIVEMLYGSGLRVSELICLKKGIFTGKPEHMIVKGKGSKERLVPISSYTTEAIDTYLELLLETRLSNSQYLFPTNSQQGYINRELVFQSLKHIASVARVDHRKVSPHKLRHAFASHLLENGADIMVISSLLGHANVTTTEIYTHVADRRLIETVNKNHPFAKKGAVNEV
jgi:integrase/recombinase XerD